MRTTKMGPLEKYLIIQYAVAYKLNMHTPTAWRIQEYIL